LLDDDGKIVTRKMNTDELIALSDKVQSIIENEAREGEYALFDSLVEKTKYVDNKSERLVTVELHKEKEQEVTCAVL